MRVTVHEGADGVQDGYIVDIVRGGRSVSQIGVLFDGEVPKVMSLTAEWDETLLHSHVCMFRISSAMTSAALSVKSAYVVCATAPTQEHQSRQIYTTPQGACFVADDGEARVGGPRRRRLPHPGGQGHRDPGQAPHDQVRLWVWKMSE